MCKAIADKLPGSSVTTLNLKGNAIGDEGGEAIVAATTLPGSSLTTLNLGWNKIGDKGSRARRDQRRIDNDS